MQEKTKSFAARQGAPQGRLANCGSLRDRASPLGILFAVPVVVFPHFSGSDETNGRFEFDIVRRGAIASSIEATGTVQAVETVDVGSEVSGLIAKVFVNFNDTVAAGQPIAELDRAGFQARVDEARAALKVERALADVQRWRCAGPRSRSRPPRTNGSRPQAQAKPRKLAAMKPKENSSGSCSWRGSGAATDREESQARAFRDASEAELHAALDQVEAKSRRHRDGAGRR